MWKYAAHLSYVGTHYCGWQKQKGSAAAGLTSVQETVEKALSQICVEPVTTVGSGRTDSGVHATGQVAHFILREKERDAEKIRNGLNSLLPVDIRVVSLEPVDLKFHAQHSALKKQYSYYFQQGPCALPVLEPYSWWIRKTLDLGAMNAALAPMLGEHDFKPFQASGAKPGPTVRKILSAEVLFEKIEFPLIPPGFGLVRIKLVGTGFLKQMVRGIAGTLLQVGEGRRNSDCLGEILTTMRRRDVGPTAPGRALWLEKVWYAAGYSFSG